MKEKDYIFANDFEIIENFHSALEKIQDRGVGDVEETLNRFITFLDKKTNNEKNIEEIFTIIDSEEHFEPMYLKGISFLSICEHHLVPFFGNVDIAIMPDGKIAGLSKYSDLVEYYSNAFEIQERLTKKIGEKIDETLSPQGVFVRIRGKHICSQVDGRMNSPSQFITTHSTGIYAMDVSLREEAINQFE
tara:strand:+ start:1118 stop:1687 length:570 start_codon:yes stop_codon:yes gene_type:complete